VESNKKFGDAGWLHVLIKGDKPNGIKVPVKKTEANEPCIDFSGLARECMKAVNAQRLAALADGLGISIGSLRRLRVGWYPDKRAWTFPMTDCGGKVLGIRLRLTNGKKISVKGGHEGLFIPTGNRSSKLIVCEGPTDTAALLDFGFMAIGRPNCSGGVRHLIALVREWRPEIVTIMADADEPGQKGAKVLARCLESWKVRSWIVTPPAKDARTWKNGGATKQDVEKLIRWKA